MTTIKTANIATLTQEVGERERFPDYPPRDDMQNWIFLYSFAVTSSLQIRLTRRRPDATVANEVPVAPTLPTRDDVRIPDLIVMFGADLDLLKLQNGYAIDRQGKPPEFALEIASPTTGSRDYGIKRDDYERYGIQEYWRFDASGGDYHDAALAGDRLVDGRYEPIAIEEIADGMLRGYSDILQLFVCWEDGELRFFDPETSEYLPTHHESEARADDAEIRAYEESSRANDAEARAYEESSRANDAEYRAGEESARADAAETRVAQLEAELRRLRGE